MKLLIILASFVIVLLFLVITAIFLEQYWRKYQAQQAARREENHPNGAPSLTESIAQRMEQLRAMVQPSSAQPRNEEMVKTFRAWVMRELEKERELQSWLLALSDSGVALLIHHLAAFCKELNFDLKWLLEQQVTLVPELKAGMQAAIIDYCRACYRTIPVQKQAKLFAAYQQLLQNPTGKEEQALGRALFANLAAQGLTSPAATDLSNATAGERQQQALRAIQQSAANDWPRFAQVLQATLAPNPVQPPLNHGQPGNGVPPQAASTPIVSQPEAQKVG